VSAILKALKKLEQDTAATAGTPLRRDAKRHNRLRSKSVMAPVLIGVAVSILVGMGVAVLFRKPAPFKTMQKAQAPPTSRKDSRPVPGPVSRHFSAIPKNVVVTVRQIRTIHQTSSPANLNRCWIRKKISLLTKMS